MALTQEEADERGLTGDVTTLSDGRLLECLTYARGDYIELCEREIDKRGLEV